MLSKLKIVPAFLVLASITITAPSRLRADPGNINIDPRFTDISPKPIGHKHANGASFVQLKDGRMMLFYGAPAHIEAPLGTLYIACRTTADDGKTWSAEQKVAQHKDCNAIGSTVLKTKDGALHVFYAGFVKYTKGKTEAPDTKNDLWTVKSADDGKTWSQPEMIFKGYVGQSSSVIQTKSGHLVLPFSYSVPNPERHVSAALVSGDNGKTWKKSNAVDVGSKGEYQGGAVEPAVFEFKDEKLWMLIRTNVGKYYEAFSTDHGLSWSKPAATKITASDMCCAIRRLASGRIAMVWNPQAGRQGRKQLAIAFSGDEGKTWSKPIAIASTNFDRSMAIYPYLAERKPGVIWIGFIHAHRSWREIDSKVLSAKEAELAGK